MDLASNPAISGVMLDNNGTNALTLDAGELIGDGDWDDADIPYRLTGDVTVPLGTTLTIGPGQIVSARVFNGDELLVAGTLIANGSTAAPIIFTSERDDALAFNIDNGNSAPARGNWDGIRFLAGSTGNVLEHVEVRYGGAGLGAITANGGEVAIRSSLVRDSALSGVLATNGGTAEITNSLIFANSGSGIQAAAGATVTAINNTIDGNTRGVQATDANTDVTLTNNLITFQGFAGIAADANATLAITFNDVFNPTASRGNYDGLANQTDLNGNVSVDPLYEDRAAFSFTLGEASPVVDAGFGTGAPAADHDGKLRVDDPAIANTGGGTPAFFDLGAFERDRWLSQIDSPIRSGEILQGDTLRFRASGLASPGPTRFEWDFGDGMTARVEDPGLITLRTPGTKDITFQVVSADGEVDPEPATLQLVVVADTGPRPDLSVTKLDLPNGLAFGRLNEIAYTVRNLGDAAINAATWQDAIYLSSDEFLDSSDKLLATREVSQSLAVGGSYAGQFDIPFSEQQFAVGTNHLLLSVDDRWEILERRQLNNEQSLETTAAIPELTSGVRVDAAFEQDGVGHYYKIEVAAGQNILAVLDDLDDAGINELYLRHGELPTRTRFDARHTGLNGADRSALVSAPAPGTWFILAFGSLRAGDGAYSIMASTSQLLISDTTPARHGTAADMVLTIQGAGFGGSTMVELIADDASVFAATQVQVNGFTNLTATFAAGSVPAGVYDIRVTRDLATDTRIDALTVIAGGEAHFEAKLIAPSVVGYHQLATLYVEYSNTGDLAIPAPLVLVTEEQSGQRNAFLSLDGTGLTRGFWTSALPAGFSHAVQFLAQGATPGFLQPGESVRVPVYYAGVLEPFDFARPPIVFKLGTFTADNPGNVPWDALKDELRPDTIAGTALGSCLRTARSSSLD
ncbi:MAG: right-handed parallel beta-helix repeat-containing protein, partial [Planctomycetota bacterium]